MTQQRRRTCCSSLVQTSIANSFSARRAKCALCFSCGRGGHRCVCVTGSFSAPLLPLSYLSFLFSCLSFFIGQVTLCAVEHTHQAACLQLVTSNICIRRIGCQSGIDRCGHNFSACLSPSIHLSSCYLSRAWPHLLTCRIYLLFAHLSANFLTLTLTLIRCLTMFAHGRTFDFVCKSNTVPWPY